jgi:NAD(P)-dependent dehydrogenase (short-subunit alcohol dehydrogenase family)
MDVLRTNNLSKRMAVPLEIATLAVYLASDDSAYVAGADFLIDGGHGHFGPGCLTLIGESRGPLRNIRGSV